MAILGLILLVFFGWLAWQIVVFMAAAAITAIFVIIMMVFGLGVVLTDPTLAHSPAAVATILIVGGIIIAIVATARNSGASTSPRKPRGPFD